MPPAPTFFAKPDTALMQLQVRPRLASWMAAGHPDQDRLARFLAHAETVLEGDLRTVPDPLALRLEVGLPADVSLLEQHDLDNYVFPLVTRLTRTSGRQFRSVWAAKQHGETSFVGVQRAVPRAEPLHGERPIHIRTDASSATAAYKEQIGAQLAAVDALPDGPVALELAFIVGPRRNWVNLWKPTMDTLDPLLGRASPERRWHPRDGRVVELGLHQEADAALGNDVLISVAARQAR